VPSAVKRQNAMLLAIGRLRHLEQQQNRDDPGHHRDPQHVADVVGERHHSTMASTVLGPIAVMEANRLTEKIPRIVGFL